MSLKFKLSPPPPYAPFPLSISGIYSQYLYIHTRAVRSEHSVGGQGGVVLTGKKKRCFMDESVLPVVLLSFLPPPYCFCGWPAFPDPVFLPSLSPAVCSGSTAVVSHIPHPTPTSAVDPPERSCEGGIPNQVSDSWGSQCAKDWNSV